MKFASRDDVQIKDSTSTFTRNTIVLPRLVIPSSETGRNSTKVEMVEGSTQTQSPLDIKVQKSSLTCKAKFTHSENELEYLRSEVEAQRALIEYHSERAHKAELMNAVLRQNFSRISKLPSNLLTMEYGMV